MSGPLAGRLLTERGHPSGAELVLGANIMRVAEPEFAFRLGRTLGPGDGPYEVDTVMGAVDALLPSIEVPDSRFVDFSAVGERQLIADDGCAHEYVVGAAGPDTWRDVDLAEHAVSISAGPGREHAGKGGNALGDPRVALTWLVNEVTALGGSVEAGQIVMTGACAVPLPVEPGDAVVADFGPLGTVTASFA
ncbi:MAG: hydratase [Actinobacteria bacterium]|nr:hydratase [Actinomycetota bacterium]